MTLTVALTHRFPGFALDVAFQVPPGVTALFGPSGSGKSTIVNAVAGLLRPDCGRIVQSGRILLDTDQRLFLPPHQRRIGCVFQDDRLMLGAGCRIGRRETFQRLFQRVGKFL